MPLPPGLASAFLAPTTRPLFELLRRYARTHGPFTTSQAAARFGLEQPQAEIVLRTLHAEGKLLEGEFRPGGIHREWCDPDVLQQVRRKTLAKLRREVEPAGQQAFARMLCRWQGVTVPRRGVAAVADAVEILQGASLVASDLEREILASRVIDYEPGYLDALLSSGEVVWVGKEQIGDRDGRIALYLAESLPSLLGLDPDNSTLSDRAKRIEEFLAQHGASFFAEFHQACGGGYPGDTLDALWELVWAGRITNDTLAPLRDLIRSRDPRSREIKSSAGRWSLIRRRMAMPVSVTEWTANIARQLLTRYGIVMRETAIAENISGGYPTVYPAFKTMEESGWVRRGMFVSGMGAAQFALNSAVDILRSGRILPEHPEAAHLAAADPANPYGALLPWPRTEESAGHLARAAGASVILVDGQLAGFLRRNNPAIRVFLPDNEPERTRVARALAKKLGEVAVARQARRSGLLIGTIDGLSAREHFLARFLEEAGFVSTALGFQMRRVIPAVPSQTKLDNEDENANLEISETA